jgi:DNA-binding protein HU-beta
MAGVSKMTKTQFLAAISEGARLDKKQVSAVFDALSNLIKEQLGPSGPGELTIPGLVKLKAKSMPATADGETKHPFTGQMTFRKGKPASRKVRATPIKALKDLVGTG